MATPSHSRKPSAASRPTTPLRPPSRTSLRASQTTPSGPLSGSASDPLAALEPAFAELSDSMADLEANFMHLQLLNESLNRFNECFGGFLYGLNMSAFCVDFPEVCKHTTLHDRTTQKTNIEPPRLQHNNPLPAPVLKPPPLPLPTRCPYRPLRQTLTQLSSRPTHLSSNIHPQPPSRRAGIVVCRPRGRLLGEEAEGRGFLRLVGVGRE